MRVALINMPFGSIYRPSIGLSLLKSGLENNDIDCDIHYLNLKFADMVSPELYNAISEGHTFSSNALAGEMVFSKSLFGKDTLDSYIKEAKVKLGNPSEDFEIIYEIQSHVESFMEACLTEIDWSKYSVIGFTSVFEQNVASISFAKRLKEKYPEKFIIFGGANCEETMGTELIRQFSFIDAICSGEGDDSFVTFISEWKTKNNIPNVGGILLQDGLEDKKERETPRSKSIVNLDNLPYPDYSDYFEQFVECHYGDQVENSRFLFESSRGCWWGQKHHCVFCGLNGTNMNFRSKSADRALEELMYLSNKYKDYTTKASAVDNIIDMAYFKSLLPELKEKGLDLDMFYETKANLKKSQIELFRDANFRTIQPGIESLQTSVLKLMNKGVTMLQNIQLLKWSKEFGVLPIWNILYGFPKEDPEEYQRLPELVNKITHLTPPGSVAQIRLDRFSPYFNNYKENGLTSVRAMWPYKHIYSGIEENSVDRIAYHFDYDYSEPRDPLAYTSDLRKAVSSWREFHSNSDLFFVDKENGLIVVDMRDSENIEITVLKDEERLLFMSLDAAKSLSNAHKEVQKAGYDISLEEASSIVEGFIQKSLVLEEDGRFISLALNTSIYSPKKASLIRLSEWNKKKTEKTAVYA
ncbi:RiPP maturation radical SAM C-methyltransferase [Pseudalkalibacillus berkeleyi]|uniref:RiPP maturation radical SAM C-methyltransferase n=1 Tax=Pseudalkalibacillus berkeleyi TaxID=1069813 RepID=A0ABS9GYK0_9BACL|nr:RiPP maturation radical SAM C-methyltransferase [Pseudalkalibacillus berkeleyi]MCF6136450.1 RiPP maturation radical SAM C-methyltransferase [Pseudalkalibacillus berkeleyi]